MADLITDDRLKSFLPHLADLTTWTGALNDAMARLGNGGRAGLDSRRRYWTKAKALCA